ncbi:MAG: NAD(P)H-dependent oxidoreductase, partial [Gammaproteobacteria bacterium SHHR-1]
MQTLNPTGQPISVLILFAHPYPHRSRVNRALLEGVHDLPGVTINDLYERYPNFHIDIQREQELL